VKISVAVLLAFIVGAAAGAAAGLYFYCPTLCKRGVRTGVSGFLGKLGLDPGLAKDIADELPI
jgi:hypothetical protein